MGDLDLGTKDKNLQQGTHMTVKYESSLTYHSKVMANVKFFSGYTRETDRQAGQKIMHLICWYWGIKI